MLCATPRLALGLAVRAMSKPTTEPGPPAASTTHQHDEQPAAARGRAGASTAVQTTTLAAMTAEHQPRPAQRVPHR